MILSTRSVSFVAKLLSKHACDMSVAMFVSKHTGVNVVAKFVSKHVRIMSVAMFVSKDSGICQRICLF